ncbi:hypothetical protein ASG58_16235 [Rhizobium sp. Leaf383]|nr:hypothetical protein ASG58_16235 [Rhizobium sp. Leaf383]
MGIEHLEQLLHVTGHLKSVSLQKWLANIFHDGTAPEFTLSDRRDVMFSVTPTADAVTQGMTTVH